MVITIGLCVSIAIFLTGIFVSFFFFFAAYKKTKKDIASGKIKLYRQGKLENAQSFPEDFVNHLKIVNK